MKYIGSVFENPEGVHASVKEWEEFSTVFLSIPLALESSLCPLHLQVDFSNYKDGFQHLSGL